MATTNDQSILHSIRQLTEEEQRLYADASPGDAERDRLQAIEVELDQCWDLLRQRRALRDAGKDPNQAHVRSPEVVEKYEQ